MRVYKHNTLLKRPRCDAVQYSQVSVLRCLIRRTCGPLANDVEVMVVVVFLIVVVEHIIKTEQHSARDLGGWRAHECLLSRAPLIPITYAANAFARKMRRNRNSQNVFNMIQASVHELLSMRIACQMHAEEKQIRNRTAKQTTRSTSNILDILIAVLCPDCICTLRLFVLEKRCAHLSHTCILIQSNREHPLSHRNGTSINHSIALVARHCVREHK